MYIASEVCNDNFIGFIFFTEIPPPGIKKRFLVAGKSQPRWPATLEIYQFGFEISISIKVAEVRISLQIALRT